LDQELENTDTGYDTVCQKHRDFQIHRGKVHYALLPVWMLNTKWNGKDFLFAMNGQTGKLVGDLPVDKGLYTMWLLGISAVAAAAVYAISYLLWLL
jgi:hypothetical protein